MNKRSGIRSPEDALPIEIEFFTRISWCVCKINKRKVEVVLIFAKTHYVFDYYLFEKLYGNIYFTRKIVCTFFSFFASNIYFISMSLNRKKCDISRKEKYLYRKHK